MTNPHVPPVPPPRPRVDLSPFEERILNLLIEGLTNKEIGAALGYCERSVKYYVTKMNFKLGARNRVHMVARAYQEGILTCP